MIDLISIIDVFEEILNFKEIVTVNTIKQVADLRSKGAVLEDILELIEGYLDKMEDWTIESRKKVRSFKVEMGIEVDDDYNIEGLSKDELLNMGAGEMSDLFGLNSVYIKYLLEVLSYSTGKHMGEIDLRDMLSTPEHYFMSHDDYNAEKLNAVREMIDWLRREIKKREENV